MKELYAHRARLRKERGCIDFESGEVKLILDENGPVSYTHLIWMRPAPYGSS